MQGVRHRAAQSPRAEETWLCCRSRYARQPGPGSLATRRVRSQAERSGRVWSHMRGVPGSIGTPKRLPSPLTAAPISAGSPAWPSTGSHASIGRYSLAMWTAATSAAMSRRRQRIAMTSSRRR